MGLLLWLFMSVAGAAETPRVVATIHPLALLVGDVAGESVSLTTLLPPGTEPHHAMLGIRQRQVLAEADLVFWVGPDLEAFLAKTLALRKDEGVLRASAIVGETKARVQGETDAHLWLNPENGRRLYDALADWFSQRYPAMAATIRDRQREFHRRFEETLGDLRDQFPVTGKGYIADHDAYRHFSDYFDIPFVGALTDSAGLSLGARTHGELRRAQNAACVVVEASGPSPGARNIARHLGIDTVVVDPMAVEVESGATGGGYLALLRRVAQGFRQCLDG
jgi:zinc transport system substrate-binding protein